MLFMTDHQQQLAGISVGMNFSPSQAVALQPGDKGIEYMHQGIS